MKPEVGDYVKVFLKNSLQIEGKVYSWEDKIVLSSEDNSNFMVIKNPKHIIMYKLTKSESLLKKETIKEESFNCENNEEFNGELNDPLRLRTLAELHKLKIEEEKKAIAQKLREHHIGEVKGVKYDLPGFFKK